MIALALVILTLILFWPAMNHGFVYDDLVALVTEPSFKLGWTFDGFRWAFTSFHSGNWYPLTLLSHLLDVQIFAFRPGPHHAVSILLHAANAVLVFHVLKGLTGAAGRSAVVAALFAVHPLHVESVAWVSERKDVLCALFWILAMGAYLRYCRRRSRARYLLVCLATALALLSKPMAVTLPAALLLLDFWPLGRLRPEFGARARRAGRPAGEPGWTVVAEKLPLLALAAAASAAALAAQRSAGALGSAAAYPLPLRLGNAVLSYVRYLAKTVWPQDLAALYPFPFRGLAAAEIAGAGIALALVTVASLRAARRFPAPATGWLWFLGTLVPVIGLVQVGMQSMADRYTYLPHIGLFTALVWGACGAMRTRPLLARRLLGIGAAAVVAIFLLLARRQVTVWQSNWTLFEQMIRVDPGNWVAQTELGLLLTEQGKLEEGIARYRQSLAAKPDYAYTPFNLAVALASLGQVAEAEEWYRRTIRLDPGIPEAWHNLGEILLRKDRSAEAAAHFERAIRLRPAFAEAHHALGVALLGQAAPAKAVEHLEEAVRLRPYRLEFRRDLSLAMRKAALRGDPGRLPGHHAPP